MDSFPLVTISIITYNSSKYVLEALESVKAQTYQNIELVASDDCSTDDTVRVVSQWMNDNRARFANVRLLTAEKNTGVSGNASRARKNYQGEWVKELAGDDVLLPSCIEDNMNYVNRHPGAQVVLSNSIVFFEKDRKDEIQRPGLAVPGFFELNASEQYEALVRHDIIMNPNSQFTRVSLFQTILLDERIKNMEDRQFYWNCTSLGIKIYYLDTETVRYRKHHGALTGIAGKKLISLPYYDSWTLFYYIVRKSEMDKRGLDVSKDEKRILWYLIVKYIFKNKGNVLTRLVDKIVNKWYL